MPNTRKSLSHRVNMLVGAMNELTVITKAILLALDPEGTQPLVDRLLQIETILPSYLDLRNEQITVDEQELVDKIVNGELPSPPVQE